MYPQVALAAVLAVPETRVLVIEQDGQPVGFLPYEHHGRAARPIAHAVADGDGMVVRPGAQIDIVHALRDIGVTSFAFEHRDNEPSPLAAYEHLQVPSARILLDRGVEAWQQERPSVLSEAGRKYRKLGRELGDVTFEFAASHEHAHVLMQWKQRQNVRNQLPEDEARMTRATALIRAFGSIPSDSPVQSYLSVLRAGDRPVAMNWGFCAGGIMVISAPTLDLDVANYSPGLLLQIELLKVMDQVGAVEADLGLGANQTKKRLSTHEVPIGVGAVFTSPLGRAYRRARTVFRQRVKGY